MQPTGFLCPECSTPLRLRDRSQLGREIACPECAAALRLEGDRGEVRAVRLKDAPRVLVARASNSRTILRAVWMTTGIVGALIVWIVSRPRAEEQEVLPSQEQSPDLAAIDRPEAGRPGAVGGGTVEAGVSDPMAQGASPEPAVAVADKPLEPSADQPKMAPSVEGPNGPLSDPPVAEDRPLMPEFAPEPPPVDIARQLSLPIAEFAQHKPAEVRLLLRQIAELSAVPVDLSLVEQEPWKSQLDRQITLELQETSIQGVLDEILRQAGLAARQGAGVLEIVPAD